MEIESALDLANYLLENKLTLKVSFKNKLYLVTLKKNDSSSGLRSFSGENTDFSEAFQLALDAYEFQNRK